MRLSGEGFSYSARLWAAISQPADRDFCSNIKTETTTMTKPEIPVTEDELHAYVDNELPAERRADVEAWLAAHPDDAERVRSWRAMAEALHARYDAIAGEPVPEAL